MKMPTILIVDDSPTMRQLIKFALKRIANSRVIEASDGVDALKKLSSEKIDIILSDINMPLMNGIQLVSHLKENPAHKDIPIIMITTEGAEEEREKAIALGANTYLTKPIQTPELLKLVNNYIS
ncbi:MAG: response regulator [Nitrospirota bacterium]